MAETDPVVLPILVECTSVRSYSVEEAVNHAMRNLYLYEMEEFDLTVRVSAEGVRTVTVRLPPR